MATNNITGDSLVSKAASDAYRNNFDSIFRKDKMRYAAGYLTEIDGRQDYGMFAGPCDSIKEIMRFLPKDILQESRIIRFPDETPIAFFNKEDDCWELYPAFKSDLTEQ